MKWGDKEHVAYMNRYSGRYEITGFTTMVNVSGDIETTATADKMNWAGRFIEGYFIRRYNPHTGHTNCWLGDTDEDGEPCGFESKADAERYLAAITGVDVWPN